MTRYPCSGCGSPLCDGRCFTECAADYPEPEETISTITLDELLAEQWRIVRDTDPETGNERVAA